MYSALLDDILQDIKDDPNFPSSKDKVDQINYLRYRQLDNPHIKEAVDEFELYLDNN